MLKLVLAATLLSAGSRADRAALYDYLLDKTMARESFSPIKNEKLGLDVEENMLRARAKLLDADTDVKLFYALVELSNARKDRHLSVSTVEGGLSLGEWGDVDLHVPLRFYADYADKDGRFLFVRDTAKNLAKLAEGPLPELGDRVVGVNGKSFGDYFREAEPYYRYSTPDGLWWHLAIGFARKSADLPPWLYRERLELELERQDGERYALSVPYLRPDDIEWNGHGDRRYPGFDLAFSTNTYDLYQNFEGKNVLLISWYGFREHLVPDVDQIIEYAREHDLLDHAVIFDGTRSRGGSNGVHAVQRLSPRPFKTTFGNLRLSDTTEAFIEGVKKRADADDAWLVDWLTDDVVKGLEAGQSYSNNVPFKLAHLPKYSDGIVEPAPVHFTGPLVCLFGPQGGSHLDQFASIVSDNALGYTIGMPTGGYSNTWEWEETLRFPTSGAPLVEYMWSIGHTIRPNGEILEGNPAPVGEYVPLTRYNFEIYHQELLGRAYKYLESQ